MATHPRPINAHRSRAHTAPGAPEGGSIYSPNRCLLSALQTFTHVGVTYPRPRTVPLAPRPVTNGYLWSRWRALSAAHIATDPPTPRRLPHRERLLAVFYAVLFHVKLSRRRSRRRATAVDTADVLLDVCTADGACAVDGATRCAWGARGSRTRGAAVCAAAHLARHNRVWSFVVHKFVGPRHSPTRPMPPLSTAQHSGGRGIGLVYLMFRRSAGSDGRIGPRLRAWGTSIVTVAGAHCGKVTTPPPPLAISHPLQSPPPTRETVTSMFF